MSSKKNNRGNNDRRVSNKRSNRELTPKNISPLFKEEIKENKYTPHSTVNITIVKNAAVIALFITVDFFSFLFNFFLISNSSLGLNSLLLLLLTKGCAVDINSVKARNYLVYNMKAK